MKASLVREPCRPTIRAYLGACRTWVRLLRPTRDGIFPRSFPLHSPRYAREMIAETCSPGVALATAPPSPTGSSRVDRDRGSADPVGTRYRSL
jgi:hypothetical protein